LRSATVSRARECRIALASELEAAERAYGVPASVVAAILYVESRCGRNTGSSVILPRLAKLAMATDPETLQANLDRLAGDDPDVAAEVRARARYLDATFYPEVRATFEVAARLGVEPLALRGSGGGAFGSPQFLPTSYLEDGVDADHDGRVDLDDPADAAASCAHYLERRGWRPDGSTADHRAAIWQYNHSEAYVSAVLGLARAIESPASVTAPARSTGPRSRATTARPKRGRPPAHTPKPRRPHAGSTETS
jgi:membrane-bound lytic murein transglycosylase B